MKALKNKKQYIPRFKNEDEERDFWDKHSVLDFPDVFKPVKLDLSNLKPSTAKITLRLPKILLESLKIMANKRDVPYQSLLKVFLAEKVNEEARYTAHRA